MMLRTILYPGKNDPILSLEGKPRPGHPLGRQGQLEEQGAEEEDIQEQGAEDNQGPEEQGAVEGYNQGPEEQGAQEEIFGCGMDKQMCSDQDNSVLSELPNLDQISVDIRALVMI